MISNKSCKQNCTFLSKRRRSQQDTGVSIRLPAIVRPVMQIMVDLCAQLEYLPQVRVD